MATKEASILIVDDHEDTAKMLSSLLDHSLAVEHVCHTAQSGEEAIRRLESTFFHLVLTDIQMPACRGSSCARRSISSSRIRSS